MHINFNLSKKVLAWYDNNKRKLPWRVGKRSSKKLYYRLLSEFMLQQTQVKTVIPYFEKFTKKVKTLNSLSRCSEKKILKLWEGLGYYRRARYLLATSKILVNKYNSKLPDEIDKVKALPGIGEYTANALLGLINNQQVIALDGNVKRVFSRILNKSEKKINFKKFFDINKSKLFCNKRNSDFVEALMEFGALICKPRNPECKICNLKSYCKYFNSSNKFQKRQEKIFENRYYNIFCYLNKKKQIALTKKNNFGFLNKFNLPEIKEGNDIFNTKDWKFLKKYNNSISNKKLSINLYYKFSKTKPKSFTWHSIEKNKEFIPSFTKKIFNQLSVLF